MHMKESATTTNPNVVRGAVITKDTLVGLVGTTGSSTGNHLHYGIIIDGGTNSTIDHCINPMAFYPNLNFTY